MWRLSPGIWILVRKCPKFAQKNCEDNGIIFVGSKVSVLKAWGTKITPRDGLHVAK